MCRIVVVDTSYLIALNDLDEMSLLRSLYDRVLMTKTVRREFHGEIPDWIEVVEIHDSSLDERLRETIDPGEASSLVLALETPGSRIVLDDLKGRRRAK